MVQPHVQSELGLIVAAEWLRGNPGILYTTNYIDQLSRGLYQPYATRLGNSIADLNTYYVLVVRPTQVRQLTTNYIG